MSDYTYKPDNTLEDYSENQDILLPKSNVEASTTLSQLDEMETIEIINRNMDEFSKVKSVDNPYPDILKSPLYTRVVPEGGLLINPNKTINTRTSALSDNANKEINEKIKKNGIGNTSIKDFASSIASSLIEVINDLLAYRWGEDDFMDIFTKEDRLLAIGVLLIIISVFFIFFKNA